MDTTNPQSLQHMVPRWQHQLTDKTHLHYTVTLGSMVTALVTGTLTTSATVCLQALRKACMVSGLRKGKAQNPIASQPQNQQQCAGAAWIIGKEHTTRHTRPLTGEVHRHIMETNRGCQSKHGHRDAAQEPCEEVSLGGSAGRRLLSALRCPATSARKQHTKSGVRFISAMIPTQHTRVPHS